MSTTLRSSLFDQWCSLVYFSEVALCFFFSSSNEYAVSLLPLWICDQPLCHELGGPAAALPLLQRESHCCVKRLCVSLSRWNAVLHFHQVLNKPKADDWVCVAHFWSCRSRDVSSLTVEQSGCEGINSLIFYFLLFFSFIEQHATAAETNGNCSAVSCWGFLRRESSKCDLGLEAWGGGGSRLVYWIHNN